MNRQDSVPEVWTIHGTTVAPGEQSVIRLPVGRLHAGNQIQVQAHIYRSRWPGPVVLVIAGVHGDEINGVEIVRRLIVEGVFESLQSGSVIAIPILNLYGFIHFSRDVPDGKDINRSFPGNVKGSLASRVARTLTKKVLPLIDFGIDFHTGGRGHYNYPQVRYTDTDARAKELAQIFGAPFLLAKRPIARSLRKAAFEAEKPVLVYEGGENMRYDALAITKGLEGLKRLLAHHEMITTEELPAPQPVFFQKSTWVRATRAGMFRWRKEAGQPVRKGETIGLISDPYGRASVPVNASRNGHLIGHTNLPVVSQGDALFHIGSNE